MHRYAALSGRRYGPESRLRPPRPAAGRRTNGLCAVGSLSQASSRQPALARPRSLCAAGRPRLGADPVAPGPADARSQPPCAGRSGAGRNTALPSTTSSSGPGPCWPVNDTAAGGFSPGPGTRSGPRTRIGLEQHINPAGRSTLWLALPPSLTLSALTGAASRPFARRFVP